MVGLIHFCENFQEIYFWLYLEKIGSSLLKNFALLMEWGSTGHQPEQMLCADILS